MNDHANAVFVSTCTEIVQDVGLLKNKWCYVVDDLCLLGATTRKRHSSALMMMTLMSHFKEKNLITIVLNYTFLIQ